MENVENVVKRLQEEMGRVDEVGKVLEDPLVPGAVVDEGEIDDELEVMEQEERREREKNEAEVTRRLQELENQDVEKTEQRVPDKKTSRSPFFWKNYAGDATQAERQGDVARA